MIQPRLNIWNVLILPPNWISCSNLYILLWWMALKGVKIVSMQSMIVPFKSHWSYYVGDKLSFNRKAEDKSTSSTRHPKKRPEIFTRNVLILCGEERGMVSRLKFGYTAAGYKFRLYVLSPHLDTLEIDRTQIGRELNLSNIFDCLEFIKGYLNSLLSSIVWVPQFPKRLLLLMSLGNTNREEYPSLQFAMSMSKKCSFRW